MPENYDALLVVSFGGPEGPDDVIPFLENVLRGKNVPRERMLEVAEHYYHFGGKSPINDQNRELIASLGRELREHGIGLPIYWGNRNWAPFLNDTVRQMETDGVRRALAFVTSAFGSYSGCRQYREDIERARAASGPGAPVIEKIRGFFNHPGFIETMVLRVSDGLAQIPENRRQTTRLVYTAHSIPVSMAETSPYVGQIRESCRLVSAAFGREDWILAYQSRSGPPSQPWLEPDVLDVLREQKSLGVEDVLIIPIGFISDHMEVLYDLDTEAADLAREIGLNLVRVKTAESHPRFVAMLRELIEERISGAAPAVTGALPPAQDVCPIGCCPPPARPQRPQPVPGQ